MSFKTGDKVRLKPGDVDMEVEKIDGDRVYCRWHEKGKTQEGRDNFHKDTLEKVGPAAWSRSF